MPSECPDCGTDVWVAVNIEPLANAMLETRRCEHGHEWTDLLVA
jgi:hypothetical protein